jgi:hypothetical protein
MQYFDPEPTPIAPQPDKARRVSPLTPRQQRMLAQARRWRAKGPGAREQRRRELRISSTLAQCLGRLRASGIEMDTSKTHWITNI